MLPIIIGIAILLAGAVVVLIYFITKKTDSPSTTPPPTSPSAPITTRPAVPTTSAPVNIYDNWVSKSVPISSNLTTLGHEFRVNPTRNIEDGRKWCTSVCDLTPQCNTAIYSLNTNGDDCLAGKSLNNTLAPSDYWNTSFNKSVPVTTTSPVVTTVAPVNMYDNWVTQTTHVGMTQLDRKSRDNPTLNIEDGRKWCTSVCDSTPECNTILHAYNNGKDDCQVGKSINRDMDENSYWSIKYNKLVPNFASYGYNWYDNVEATTGVNYTHSPIPKTIDVIDAKNRCMTKCKYNGVNCDFVKIVDSTDNNRQCFIGKTDGSARETFNNPGTYSGVQKK